MLATKVLDFVKAWFFAVWQLAFQGGYRLKKRSLASKDRKIFAIFKKKMHPFKNILASLSFFFVWSNSS